MVVQTADEAVGNAKAWSSCDKGMCLYTVQEWIESPHAYPDAATQWHNAKRRHTDDDPPEGAPVFWTGGGSGYGHVAISLGNSRIRSTDCTSTYDVSDCDLSWPRTHWGLTYAGWTEDLGGVDIPYLVGGTGPSNPNDVEVGDLVLVTAAGALNGRDEPDPAGEVVATLPNGASFTVAELVEGWAAPATAKVSPGGSSAVVELVDVKATDYLHGVDVSSHQTGWTPDDADEYVFVKATEGTTYANPAYADQLYEARAAGIVVGHYHWLNDGDVGAQVDYFLATADLQPGDMIACDWEDSSNPTTAQKDKWIQTVQDRLAGAHRVGLYCNRDWWINHDTSSFYGDFLWIANYTTADDPGIEAEWLFWQYTSTPIDQNRGRFADRDALRAWAGGGVAPVPPDPPTDAGPWYSSDYLWPKLANPANAGGVEVGDLVEVTASGGLNARSLPGGPQTVSDDGTPLVRATGYQFDVVELVDGWAGGGTNWYSTDYLATVTAPATPTWSSKPTTILDDPTPDPNRNVSYLQAVVRVAAMTDSNGKAWPACYVLAQDLDDDGNLRFARCEADGTYNGDWFMVNDAGHGQTFHAYRSLVSGALNVWCGEDPAYVYGWQSGKTVSRSSGTKMDYKGSRPVGSFEPWVGFRDATDTQETFYLFDRTDFTDGINQTSPAKSVKIAKQTKRSQQSWAVSDSRIYRLSGSTNDDPPHGSMLHVFEVFDWSGKCLLTLDVTAMAVSTTSDEPEGVTFTGTPGSVLVGKREGSTDPAKRSYPLWTMGGLP